MKLADTTASKVAAGAEAELDYEKSCALLEAAWKKAGVLFEAGVWFPQFLDGMKLNCGLYVDFLLDKRLAVMVAGSDKTYAMVEKELGFCSDSTLFEDALVLNFGKRFRATPFSFNNITRSWIKVTPPPQEA